MGGASPRRKVVTDSRRDRIILTAMLRQLFGDQGIYGDYRRGLKRSDQSSLGKAFSNASITRMAHTDTCSLERSSDMHLLPTYTRQLFPPSWGGGLLRVGDAAVAISPSPLKKVPTGVTLEINVGDSCCRFLLYYCASQRSSRPSPLLTSMMAIPDVRHRGSNLPTVDPFGLSYQVLP